MPRLVEADNESQVSGSVVSSSLASKSSSLMSGNKAGISQPPSNRPRPQSVFTGPMTLELIEDYLNPISNRPIPCLEPGQSGLLSLQTATGGYGLCMNIPSVPNEQEYERYLSKKQEEREEAEDTYLSLRKEFEDELIRMANRELTDENNVK